MAKVELLSAKEVNFNELKRLRSYSMLCTLCGDYKGYKTAQRDFAKLAVKNPELLNRLAGDMIKIKVPLFSIMSLKFLKVWFLNLFRRKSLKEKELLKIVTKERLAKQHNIYV